MNHPAAELADNHETVSEQFIAYVTSHSDERPSGSTEVLRESFWNIQVTLPLLADAIERVRISEHIIEDSEREATDRDYCIDVFLRSGMIGCFSHEPSNTESPFDFFWGGGDSDFICDTGEDEAVRLLEELRAYELAGQMTKVDAPPAS
jgi:hypothetical protein